MCKSFGTNDKIQGKTNLVKKGRSKVYFFVLAATTSTTFDVVLNTVIRTSNNTEM